MVRWIGPGRPPPDARPRGAGCATRQFLRGCAAPADPPDSSWRCFCRFLPHEGLPDGVPGTVRRTPTPSCTDNAASRPRATLPVEACRARRRTTQTVTPRRQKVTKNSGWPPRTRWFVTRFTPCAPPGRGTDVAVSQLNPGARHGLALPDLPATAASARTARCARCARRMACTGAAPGRRVGAARAATAPTALSATPPPAGRPARCRCG